MGLFCLPLQSCYTMVDIFLKTRQNEDSSLNSSLSLQQNNSTINGSSFLCDPNSIDLCSAAAVDDKETAGETTVNLFDDVMGYWLQTLSICVVHNLLVMVGLIGNVLNIIILSKHGIGSNTTNTLLMSLAAIDFIMLLSNGIQNITCFTCYLNPATTLEVDTSTNIYLTSPSRWISFVNLDITALIIIERAIAVFSPFKVGRLFTTRTIAVAFTVITVIIILVLTPHMIGVRPHWQYDPELNQTVANTFKFISNFDYFLIFWSLVENFNAFMCVAIILFCGTATAIKLIQQSRSRKSISSSGMSSQERKAVRMLLVICFISFLVHFPNSSNQLYSSLYLDELAKHGTYCALRALGSFLCTINATVNFFIYFFMSSKFKETYKNLACCQGKRHIEESGVTCPTEETKSKSKTRY